MVCAVVPMHWSERSPVNQTDSISPLMLLFLRCTDSKSHSNHCFCLAEVLVLSKSLFLSCRGVGAKQITVSVLQRC